MSNELDKTSTTDVELPTHHPRRTDTDVRLAKRAERQVAAMFMGSALATVLFVVAFVAVDTDATLDVPIIGVVNTQNLCLGLAMGFGLFLIGTAAIHWAKKLMSDEEIVQQRSVITSDDASREAVVADFLQGADESGFMKRPLIRRTMLLAMAIVPVPAIVLLRDLGPLPGNKLRETIWHEGVRVVTDVTYRPIRPQDIPLGGMVSAVPANLPEVEEAEGSLNARAKAAVFLVRMEQSDIKSQQIENGDYEGILAFSKICTHVGCPVALYEQRTKTVLCPCHQSTFDLSDNANVVFGPAARSLPQLAITVDKDGYLVAREGFNQPVGPSFWERG